MAPLQFSDTYSKLPATAPTGHPHIITGPFHEETDKANLRAADGVATFLYRWDSSILDKFLDPATPRLEIVRREKDRIMEDMVIAKHGQSVMCGSLSDGAMSTQLLFEICNDGSWKPISGHMEGLPAQGRHKQELLDEFETEFAKAILYHDMWVVEDGDEIKVSRG